MDERIGSTGAEPAPLKHLKVLILDEQEITRRALALILDSAGASVTCADSLPEALAFLDVRRFDAIITDAELPGAASRGGRRVLGAGPNAMAPVFGIGGPTGLPAPVHAAGMVVEIGRLLDPARICHELEALGPRAAAA